MTAESVLDELRGLGTEQARKIYRRHGVRNEAWGVSYADLEKHRKRIRVDHALALALWDSGVHDARILATKVADAERADAALLDRWAAGADNQIESDAVAGVAATSGAGRELLRRWLGSDAIWVARAGWSLLARLALDGAEVPEGFFESHLATIEREIHGRPDRIKEAMNSALIAIGCRGDALERRALDAAARIGKVEVDHGETECKTPDAAAYLQKR